MLHTFGIAEEVAPGEQRRRLEFFAPAFQRLVTLVRHRVK